MRPLQLLALVATFAGSTGLLGCDTAPAVTEEGAFSVSFLRSSNDCAVSSHNGSAGQVSPTDSKVVQDGDKAGDQINCTIVGTSTFNISASATSGADALSITIPSITAGASQANPAKGSVVFESPTTVNGYASTADTPCDFFFVNDKQGLIDGGVWVSFTCAKMVGSNGDSTCSLGESYAVFEHCATSSQ